MSGISSFFSQVRSCGAEGSGRPSSAQSGGRPLVETRTSCASTSGDPSAKKGAPAEPSRGGNSIRSSSRIALSSALSLVLLAPDADAPAMIRRVASSGSPASPGLRARRADGCLLNRAGAALQLLPVGFGSARAVDGVVFFAAGAFPASSSAAARRVTPSVAESARKPSQCAALPIGQACLTRDRVGQLSVPHADGVSEKR